MPQITLNFTTNNNPTKGYIVKYREVGTSQYTIISPNPTSSPIIITGLGSGLSYEGTIQADCGNGQYGTVSTFNATVAATFNVSRDPSSATAACALTTRNYTFYAGVAVLQVGTQLYSNITLTTAYTSPGYYSDGTWVYQVNASGIVLSKATCSLP
jgi:hypothetical protein